MEKENGKRLNGSPIPVGLVIKILSRLPAKSVVRFGCVSKEWCSITTTPDFIKTFTVHSSARPSLLCVFNERRDLVFFSFPYHQDPQNSDTPVEKYQMMPATTTHSYLADNYRNYATTTYRLLNSINGLMLFGYGFHRIILNPTLRQQLVLPDHKITPPAVSFLGYDPIDQKYKVLAMSGYFDYYSEGENPENLKVLTLGDHESWRVIKILPRLFRDIRVARSASWRGGIRARGGICINGVIYYYLIRARFIVSFDVRSKTFEKIRKPEGVSDVDYKDVTCAFINYQGKLAWICTRTSSLWILEDAQKQEWSVRCVSPLDGQINHSSKHFFCGVTDAHEIIYMPKRKKEPFCGFYYDLMSKRTRQVAYQGVKQKRSYYWSTSRTTQKEMYEYDYFPNHIENLMSLKCISLADS